VVGEFAGLMPAHKIRAFVQDINEKPAPAPRLKVPVVSGQRLKQARQHLKKGRGFEAYVLLRDFAGDEAEEAAALMPLARFLMDIRDGDWPSGNGTLDEQYVSAADALASGKREETVEKLQATIAHGDPAPVTATEQVLEALFVLLGEAHPLTRKYRAEPRPA
jgi:thioredoxin-like negative regulator of GroEL